MKTASKRRIPVGAQKGAELKLLYHIVNYVEKYRIPHSLIINFDQTPSKYMQVSSMRMGKGGETNVPISSINDKQSITAMFSITLDNKFLPLQLIYKGKTNNSILKVSFPEEFSLSGNEKKYSNEKESLKLLDEFILSYIQQPTRTKKPWT